MRNAMLTLIAGVAALASVEQARAQHVVHGHVRRNGSYVMPHVRSNPDHNFYNNYSAFPNVNPYTGSVGTRHYPAYTPYRQHSVRPWGF